MNYGKKSSAIALMATALLVFATAASATTLTNSSGGTYGEGTKLKISSEGAVQMDGTVGYTCNKSTMEGKVTNVGSGSTTVSGVVESLTFTECGNHTITVSKTGSFVVHTETGSANGNGMLVTSGTEITSLTHSLFLGTRHCIYVTNNTQTGVIVGSKNRSNENALIGGGGGIPIPQSETDALCGNDAEGTGTYRITAPEYLDVD